MKTTTLRPGFLVGLSTRVTGNVKYSKLDLEANHVTDDGAAKAKWETERTIANPAEFEAATKARSKARSLITSICAHSAFGLLCPSDKQGELDTAVAEAQMIAADFNATAELTRVQVYVIVGQIAADDVEASRAINSEVRDILDAMQTGVRNMDVKVIRDAANRAREISAMIQPGASERLQVAIDTARAAATKIVKAGQAAAVEVNKQALQAITQSRTAFLDLDGDDAEIAAPAAKARAIDLPTIDDSDSAAVDSGQRAPKISAPAFEM